MTPSQDLFLCADEVACAAFYAECNRRERAAGIKPADMEDQFCPALCAKSLQIEAENGLMEAAGTHLGLESRVLNGDQREQFLDLVCRLLINHPQTAPAFTNAHTVLSRYR